MKSSIDKINPIFLLISLILTPVLFLWSIFTSGTSKTILVILGLLCNLPTLLNLFITGLSEDELNKLGPVTLFAIPYICVWCLVLSSDFKTIIISIGIGILSGIVGAFIYYDWMTRDDAPTRGGRM